MDEAWRPIHDLVEAWTDAGDEHAGATILRYLAEGVIGFKIRPEGVLLCPGPRWASRERL